MLRLFILALILFLPSFAQSQDPAPRAFVSSENQKEHASKTAKKSNAYNHGTEQNPIFVKELRTEPSTTIRDAEAKDRKQKASYERWTVISTIVIAIFTAVLGVWTILLWRETKRAAQLAQKSLNVARASNDHVAEGVYLARQELILTQRPKLRVSTVIIRQPTQINAGKQVTQGWVGPDELFIKGQYVGGQFYVSNIGGTPATITNIGCWVYWAASPLPMERPYEGKEGNIPVKHVLHPGASVPITFNSDKPLGDEAKHIRSGEAYRLWIMGWIEYRDNLQIERRFYFCRVYRPNERFEAVLDRDYESYEEEN